MILGVTGNIAAGKSSVAKELGLRGAVIVDADQLAREVVQVGSVALAKLVTEFGVEILQGDGQLDRERLGQMVFADTTVRQRVNGIVHPEIAKKSVRVLHDLSQRDDIPLIVYEAPLLFEVGAESRVDKVLVVTIAPAEQLRRLQQRDNLDVEAAKQRIASQMPQQDKVERADFVIDNSGSLIDTVGQIDALWQQLGLSSRRECSGS